MQTPSSVFFTAKRHFFLLPSLLLLLGGCSLEGQSSFGSSVKYDFPHKTVTSDYNIECKEDLIDSGLSAGSKLEEMGLDMVGDYFNITTEDEIEAGKTIHESFDFDYIEDGRTRELRKILNKMLPYVERKDLNYQVFLIEDDLLNAWTIPGGYIYVTTAMYDFVESDDEMANVLGHEIGHNENRHCSKILKKHAPASFFGLGDIGAIMVNVFSQATVAFHQPDELECDLSGFYLSYMAGYDPAEGLDFWKRMSKNENPNTMDKFFRSHPYSQSRYDCGHSHLEKIRD